MKLWKRKQLGKKQKKCEEKFKKSENPQIKITKQRNKSEANIKLKPKNIMNFAVRLSFILVWSLRFSKYSPAGEILATHSLHAVVGKYAGSLHFSSF